MDDAHKLRAVQAAAQKLQHAQDDLEDAALQAIDAGCTWRRVKEAAGWSSMSTISRALDRARERRGSDA